VLPGSADVKDEEEVCMRGLSGSGAFKLLRLDSIMTTGARTRNDYVKWARGKVSRSRA
jgi:hypothetical protein